MRLTVSSVQLLAVNYSIGTVNKEYLTNCLAKYYNMRYDQDVTDDWLIFKQSYPEVARALAALDLALCEYLHDQKDFAALYEKIKNSPTFHFR